jgi:hypothetical protein
MAESVRTRVNRYRKGDFTRGELLTILGAFVADQVIDVATYGQLSKLKGKALAKVVFPAGKAAGSIIARGGIGAAGVAGRSLVGAAAPLVTNPYAAGTALGLGVLASPPGQSLLEAAEERGRMDRIRAEQYLTNVQARLDPYLQDPFGSLRQDFTETGGIKPLGPPLPIKRRRSSYNSMVSKGIKALKKSTSYGKKGVLNSPKKAFGFVARTVSKLRRGKKVPNKGASGVVKRSLPGISKIKVRK